MPLTIPERWLATGSTATCAASTSCRLLVSRSRATYRAYCDNVSASLASGHVAIAAARVPVATLSGQRSRRVITVAASASAGTSECLQKVLSGLDELNSKDPRSVEVEGAPVPYELAYARWLTGWVLRLAEDGGLTAPSDELLITARGQHVERWKVPRSSYPEGRTSYLQWREDLKKRHAATTTGLMAAAGYSEASCKRVDALIMKRALKELEGQLVEDALCLVFLERQFAEFFPKLVEQAAVTAAAAAAAGGGDADAAAAQEEADAKMVGILQKSWKKMGPLGRAAALTLPLGPREAALVGRALAPPA